jgi:hypothetical protein
MFSKLCNRNLLRTASSSFRKLSKTAVDDCTLVTTTGALPVTTTLHINNTLDAEKIPVFRILNPQGKIMEGAEEPALDQATAVKMYEHMVRIQNLDDIFYNAQRQGRISFYMQANGEEAIHIGKHFVFLLLLFLFFTLFF